MTALRDRAPAADDHLSDRDFGIIAAMAKTAFGLHLGPTKKPLVHSRLARRLRARGLSSFADYCRLLAQPGEEAERRSMISALTTNVTQFYREAHHFDLLARDVLPPLVARARSGGRVRLWSAGCSSGQEPYSMAATVLDLCPEAPRLDLRILATDVDPDVLLRAHAGRYAPADLAALAGPVRTRIFGREADTAGSVRQEVRALVTFRHLNLLAEWPMAGRFDAIFCRNVAIYFDQPTQQRLWSRLSDKLVPGGVLFIGHSERLSRPAAARFTSVGVTAHRRRDDAPAHPGEGKWD